VVQDVKNGKRRLRELREAARECTACPLYANATQTVFGAGSADASLLLVGEQPGDEEDRSGEPFVGPAGRLLDEALAEAGIERSRVYVTNAVKHFKWEPRGKRRLHKKPRAGEIKACRPWLLGEIEAIAPQIIVALGTTASQALLGSSFRLMAQRGRLLTGLDQRLVLATVHPSFVLRQRTSDDRAAMRSLLVKDLRTAYEALGTRTDRPVMDKPR